MSLTLLREKLEKWIGKVRNTQVKQAQLEDRVKTLEREVRDMRAILMVTRGFSQRDVARQTGLSPGRVSQIISNFGKSSGGTEVVRETPKQEDKT